MWYLILVQVFPGTYTAFISVYFLSTTAVSAKSWAS